MVESRLADTDRFMAHLEIPHSYTKLIEKCLSNKLLSVIAIQFSTGLYAEPEGLRFGYIWSDFVGYLFESDVEGASGDTRG